MTAKRHKQIRGMFAPKQVRADNRYGVHLLDNTHDEILPSRRRGQDPAVPWPASRREAAADDPWLSPSRSEAVRALLIWIQAAEHSPDCPQPVDGSEVDLEAFCRDAELSGAETEVILLAGEGWRQRQIAEWLGFSQATVCRRLSTGRAKLAGCLPLAVAYRLHSIDTN